MLCLCGFELYSRWVLLKTKGLTIISEGEGEGLGNFECIWVRIRSCTSPLSKKNK